MAEVTETAHAEPMAWLPPDWRNPDKYDGKSLVAPYQVAGWIPLYTHPAEPVATALLEALRTIYAKIDGFRFDSDADVFRLIDEVAETVRVVLAGMGERS